MLMDDAVRSNWQQDNFVFFPVMTDAVDDGPAFALKHVMKSAALMKLLAGATPRRNFLRVHHLCVTSDVFHVGMDIPAEQTHRIDLQRQRFSLDDQARMLHPLALLVAQSQQG